MIRLADTYLMEAVEGGSGVRAQALLDAVRDRLDFQLYQFLWTPFTMKDAWSLQVKVAEWHDLIRTGRAASVLAKEGLKPVKMKFYPSH